MKETKYKIYNQDIIEKENLTKEELDLWNRLSSIEEQGPDKVLATYKSIEKDFSTPVKKKILTIKLKQHLNYQIDISLVYGDLLEELK